MRYCGHLQHTYSYGLGSLSQARKWRALAACTGLVDLAGLRGTRAHSALALGLMEPARERYVVQEAGGLGLLDCLGAVARARFL
jgi:hypothetical protein